MKKLSVYIEIRGKNIYVGDIFGDTSSDAVFVYGDEYAQNPENRPISISLPLESRRFNAKKTRNFFEGLLPEGFTRRCVAQQMRADVDDYLSILAGLGKECLGAIRIASENETDIKPDYRRLSDEEVKNLAKEGATESAQMVTKSHLSLTGASGKVGLYYDEKGKHWYLPIGNAPSTHIVKQSHVRLKRIVANEQLCLLTARKLGIETPESFIISTGNLDEEDILFATKRYDRKKDGSGQILNGLELPYRLHQEDFAQALGIASSEKYEKKNEGYFIKLFDLLKDYSSDPVQDQLKLWDICVFNYLIGNTDNHIKNISLLYGEDLRSIRLAPAYDIVSTMIYDSSTDHMALAIGGEYRINDITRSSFEKEAYAAGLGTKMAMKRFDRMADHFENALKEAREELKEQGFPQAETIGEQILINGGINRITK